MLREHFIGLDIGSSKIRAVAADYESGHLCAITGAAEADSAGVRDGVIVNIGDAASKVSSVVGEASSDFSTDLTHLVVNLSGKQIASLNSSTLIAITRSSRRISAEDVEQAAEQSKVIVLPPDREIVHCNPRFYRVDGQDGVRAPVGLFGSRFEFEAHIVTSTYSQIHNVAAVVREAGLSVGSVVPSSIAAAEAVLLTEEKKLGVLVADIGEGVTDIAMFVDGTVAYTSVIALGGGQIAEDISAALHISLGDARALKLKWGRFSLDSIGTDDQHDFEVTEIGTGRQKRISTLDLSGIIRPRMEELYSLIRYELIKSGNYGLLPAGAVLCGASAKLCGATSLCGRILKMPVRLGGLTHIGTASNVQDGPEYATAVGLTLYAAANPKKTVPTFENGLQTVTKQIRSFLGRLRN